MLVEFEENILIFCVKKMSGSCLAFVDRTDLNCCILLVLGDMI